MPYYRRTRRRRRFGRPYRRRRIYRRKTYRRRGLVKRKRIYTASIGTHLPFRFFNTFKWVGQTTYTDAIKSSKAFALNSIFDPGQAIFGSQPDLYDQMANMYNKYAVMSFKVVCDFVNNSASENAIVQIHFSKVSTAPNNDYTLALTYPNMRYRLLPHAGGGASNRCRLVLSGTTKRILGDNRFNLDYSATYGADPTALIYCHVTSWNSDGGDAQDVRCITTFYQRTMSWQPERQEDS